jgi:hypothetical protein
LNISFLRRFTSVRAFQKNLAKRQKQIHLAPITFGRIQTTLGQTNTAGIKILFDSGSTQTHVKKDWVKKLRLRKESTATWNTAAGPVTTSERCKVLFSLPEFFPSKVIEWEMHVGTLENVHYDMIIGNDLLERLKVDLKYSTATIEWDGAEIPMKSRDATIEDSYYIHDTPCLEEAAERIKQILDAKYAPANIDELTTKCTYLTLQQQEDLNFLLKKYESLFDGSLGTWKGESYDIELRSDATPYHARAFPIPRIHEQTLRHEVERLCQIGVLKKVNRSEWAAPTFIIPKKDGSVRFISDFRELNKRIKRKPFPIPKIQDLLLKLEGFQYATSLDLNMGYYHIELSPDSKRLCTIVLPWGKYEYQKLPMGLCNSPDIFQEKMSTLMGDLEFVRTYIDDLLITTKSTWNDHLRHLDIVFHRIHEAGLKINAKKSFFGKDELEYLGYWITRQGIQPVSKKVEAIKNIAPPKTQRELRRFIGIVNYYRDMWIRRSDVLAPLSKLTSKTVKWQWTTVEQKAFDTMKRIIARETLLVYPDFNQPFIIYTDASHTQLGAVISQNNKPIAFYSRKLNPAQTRYTTTERELLSIVETLKEFRNILLGHRIKIYTDHKNLTYVNFNTERVMRWRLIIEEYSPELLYVKGETNIVADALSRLDLATSDTSPSDMHDMQYLADNFSLEDDDLPDDAYPLQYKLIASHQNLQKDLFVKLYKQQDGFHLKSFCGGGKKRTLICRHEKIIIPKTLQRRIVTWYHNMLCHSGETRTEQTIRQQFWWSNLRNDVHNICSKCDTCQRAKRTTKKYGHLPAKEAEADPWEVLCVDLVGPYTIKRRGKKNLILWCLTMIDPATGWFEMREIPNKEAITVANLVEQTWLTRYPWPNQIVFDRGKEFMGEFARMVENDYGIKRKPTTTRNPQANSIIERIHQTIGNMIRSFQIGQIEINEEDPWTGVLAATMFATRATYHTTTQATPAQLVFGRDAILNIKFDANWRLIRERKQRAINTNNQKENKKRISHQYRVGDKVLYRVDSLSKYSENPYDGPYEIVRVNTNGTVRLKMDAVTDTVNIRLLKPYRE